MPHYFDESPGVPSAEATIVVDGLSLRTDRGVFSHGRLDAGTALLLRAAPPPPASGELLDLGCGYGAIALVLARRAPVARVWAVDVNERARALCAANAAANGFDNVTVVASDDVPEDVRFDAIWSNPPIHIGKDLLRDLLTRWLDCLSPEGRAVLVVQKHLGADSLHRWLTEQGWPTTRLASAKGYRAARRVAPRSGLTPNLGAIRLWVQFVSDSETNRALVQIAPSWGDFTGVAGPLRSGRGRPWGAGRLQVRGRGRPTCRRARSTIPARHRW